MLKSQLQGCSNYVLQMLILHSPDYLQACALVRERRAEETCDNAHDGLCYITLKHGICMLPVAGVVAHLGRDKGDISVMHIQSIRLPACGRQVTYVCPCCADIITMT